MEIGEKSDEENRAGRGYTPLVEEDKVRNGMKGKEIKAFLLGRNGTATASGAKSVWEE
jgi:hypothetical protein